MVKKQAAATPTKKPPHTRRYVAFLRGVSPMNARMPEVKKAFEAAGFTDVVTVRSSGNVVFSARPAPEAAIARRAEAAMERHLGRSFSTIVRPVDALRTMLASDPYADCRLRRGAKRIVTFLRAKPKVRPELPIQVEGACIVRMREGEVFSAYVPSPRGPVFMRLIEKTFGSDVTTRTWDTISQVAR